MHCSSSRLKIRLYLCICEIQLQLFSRVICTMDFPLESPVHCAQLRYIKKTLRKNTKCTDYNCDPSFFPRRVISIKVASETRRVAGEYARHICVILREITNIMYIFPRPDAYRERLERVKANGCRENRERGQPATFLVALPDLSSRSPRVFYTLGNAAHPKALQRRFAQMRPTQRHDFSRCIRSSMQKNVDSQ